MTSLRRPARGGFTLIELLVVVAIIAVLMSLILSGVMKVRVIQMNNNTKEEVIKLETARAKAERQVIDAAKNETPCALAQMWANGDAQLAQVLHIKLRLRQEFPQSFAEVLNPLGVPAKQSYVRALQNAQPSIHSAYEQSSILLYLSLKESRRGSEFDPDSSLSSQEITTTSDGLKVIVDAYGRPIVFIRWPALPTLDPTTAPTLITTLTTVVKTPPVDAEDPEGLMSANNYAWFATTNGQQFAASCHGPSTVVVNGNSVVYPLRPVIASTGKNGTFGDGDDFYGFNQVLGGSK
jgi:prepilin-type N-terminal cleavage/methylation domain-containing protein